MEHSTIWQLSSHKSWIWISTEAPTNRSSVEWTRCEISRETIIQSIRMTLSRCCRVRFKTSPSSKTVSSSSTRSRGDGTRATQAELSQPEVESAPSPLSTQWLRKGQRRPGEMQEASQIALEGKSHKQAPPETPKTRRALRSSRSISSPSSRTSLRP